MALGMDGASKVIFGDRVLIDLTEDTVTPDTLLVGVTAHAKNGSAIIGKFEGGSKHDEIDRILTAGLTDGYKYYLDEGNILSKSKDEKVVLKKDISNDYKTITTTFSKANGEQLGKTIKRFTDRYGSSVTTDHLNRKLTKTFSKNSRIVDLIFEDANGRVLGRMHKEFSSDGLTIASSISYE